MPRKEPGFHIFQISRNWPELRRRIAAPGKRWIYSGSAVAAIGVLIERGSGQKPPDFTRDPLSWLTEAGFE